jgi:hypothetical protein
VARFSGPLAAPLQGSSRGGRIRASGFDRLRLEHRPDDL